MPLGIQRIEAGMLTSVTSPPVNSARLHKAMACTVPRWLVTLRRWLMVASARLGFSNVIFGLMLPKYGALKQISRENSQRPDGLRVSES